MNKIDHKSAGPNFARWRTGQVGRYCRTGLLALAGLLAGYVALWIGLQIFSRYPLEFRENAVLLTAELQDRGENPYALEFRPVYVNVYGIGYYWVCYPFTRLFGCDYHVLRLVSCGFIVATSLLLYWALRGDRVSRPFAVVGAILLFVQLGQGLSIVARPDSMGLFLFVASLAIPYRFRFSPPALFCGGLFAILAFLSKPYFVLGLGVIWLYLFLFESKCKAVIFGTVAGLGMFGAITAINRFYECYFTETFFIALGASSRSWTHLTKVGGAYVAQNFALLMIVVVALFQGVVRGPACLHAVSPQPTERRRINWRGFSRPLTNWLGDLPSVVLACDATVILFVLGLHPGNDILYYHQLIAPFLIWIAVRLADSTFKQQGLAVVAQPALPPGRARPQIISSAASLHCLNGSFWLANSLLLVHLLIAWSSAAPVPQDRSAQWRFLESIIASNSDVFAAPHLARLAQRAGKTVYDAGQTEYAFASGSPVPTRVSSSYRERNKLFLQTILTKLRHRQFDLILINPGVCPFFALDELRAYYTPTGVVPAPMPFDSYLRESPLVRWVPKGKPAVADSGGVEY